MLKSVMTLALAMLAALAWSVPGAFFARHRPARTARNPRTGETVSVPAASVAAFKPGTALEKAMNADTAP